MKIHVRNIVQVQARQIACNTRAACICAVIVREWNAILAVDICESYTHPGADFVPYLRNYSTAAEPGATIHRDLNGKDFAVCITSIFLNPKLIFWKYRYCFMFKCFEGMVLIS